MGNKCSVHIKYNFFEQVYTYSIFQSKLPYLAYLLKLTDRSLTMQITFACLCSIYSCICLNQNSRRKIWQKEYCFKLNCNFFSQCLGKTCHLQKSEMHIRKLTRISKRINILYLYSRALEHYRYKNNDNN